MGRSTHYCAACRFDSKSFATTASGRSPRSIAIALPANDDTRHLIPAAIVALCGIYFAVTGITLVAADSAWSNERIIILANESAISFQAKTTDDLVTEEARVLLALERLDAQLTRWGKTGDGWRTYLKWADVQENLSAGVQGDVSILEIVADRLNSGHEGLSLAQFKNYRVALLRYTRILRALQLTNQSAEAQDRLASIAERLPREGTDLSPMDREIIGNACGWLEHHGFASEVVAALRNHYGQPNVFVRMSGNALLAGMEETLYEEIPINDHIQGAHVQGSGELRGYVRFRLTPDPNRAAVEMYSHATIHSSIRGYSDPAGFSGTGVTRISANKRVFLDLDGMIEQPVHATATTCMRTHCVWTRFRRPLINRIGTRIAARQIAASRPASERTVSMRAARQFEQQMEANAEPMLNEANEAFIHAMRVPLAEEGLLPRSVKLSTTKEHIFASVVAANDFQLATASAPPAMDGTAVMAMTMHESAMNNSANTALAGRTLESYEVSELLALLFGGSPDDYESEDGGWSMLLADQDPVQVDVEDGVMTIRLRGQGYTDESLSSDNFIEVGARYLSINGPSGPELRREGDLWVHTQTRDGVPATLTSTRAAGSNRTSSALETQIAERFAPVFVERLAFEPVLLPIGAAGAELVVRNFRLESGWILISMDQ